ncbi:MAG: NAD(P)H-dependent oxidoreductase subunit E [Bacteroidetes bacterium]|nr:NAD(P)H-dependent oxidoreductase subunit E [Bacteroidota bacterium]MBU1720030.1 NAD(P)H-dependent oxidoreductase subunit E [Bacteroidota bacterium]
MRETVQNVVRKYNNDQVRLMDILWEVRSQIGSLTDEAIDHIAGMLSMSKVDIEQTVASNHFFSKMQGGKYSVFLNNSVVACMMGRDEIATVFEKEVGVKFGEITSDGVIGLFDTTCFGMNDQEPAALINGKIFTRISRAMVKEIVDNMKSGKPISEIAGRYRSGDGNNEAMGAMVYNNLRVRGPVLFSEYRSGTALRKIIEMQPAQVIAEVKTSEIPGRGGAGSSLGMTWESRVNENDPAKSVLCTADGSEPGTFHNRVILTEIPERLFEGMAIAGYAIGANNGILYLRSEYWYMFEYLQKVLTDMRNERLLGNDILGKQGFSFDIRIQMGAGDDVCGEEVETLCAAVRVIDKGGDWFKTIGTQESTGSKALSISGDCPYPGVYEIEWGMTLRKMLEMVGADLNNVQAVQVGGKSGVLVPQTQFERKIAYEDVLTSGSMIVIGNHRDILKDIVMNFNEEFGDGG